MWRFGNKTREGTRLQRCVCNVSLSLTTTAPEVLLNAKYCVTAGRTSKDCFFFCAQNQIEKKEKKIRIVSLCKAAAERHTKIL